MTMLPDFRLETYLGKWEFSCRYHMTASDMETMTVRELLAMDGPDALDAFLDGDMAYIAPTGTDALRGAVSGTYETIAPQDILAFAGAEEGVFAAAHALLTPDDHAVVLTPNYQSAEELPLSLCETTGVPLRPKNGFDLDMAEFRSAMRPNTRFVYINFPHNPTGKVISEERLEEIVSVCREFGSYLFSDEVYRGLERKRVPTLPQVADIYEKGLSLNVMSKAYGLPGLRVGWIACRDRDLLWRMERIKHYLSICNAGPSEHLAVVALKNRARILERNHALIDRNLDLMREFFGEFPNLFEWYEPDGGCIAYPRYMGRDGVEAFCRRLVEERGVVLLPASIYGSSLTETPADRFRIGFGRSHVEEGLSEMRAFLKRNA